MSALAIDAVAWHAVVGIVGAALIAACALRAHALTRSGAVAATVVGAVAVSAGWGWGALLIVYFLISTLLTRWRRELKAARTGETIEKGGPRDAHQVLANGGVYCVAALGYLVGPAAAGARWIALGAGTLAASAADSWATEIGTAAGKDPRSILTLRPVTAGTSGGISFAGTLAAVCGALIIAGLAVALEAPRPIGLCVFAGGISGALVDSILGATLQERRRCPVCDLMTEQRTHRCGAPTLHAAGIRGFDNDAVNLVASTIGGLLAMALIR